MRPVFTWYRERAREPAGRTGAVTVVVSYRFSSVVDADRFLVMHRGEPVESGGHDGLMALGGRYAKLYAVQADAYTGLLVGDAQGRPERAPLGPTAPGRSKHVLQ